VAIISTAARITLNYIGQCDIETAYILQIFRLSQSVRLGSKVRSDVTMLLHLSSRNGRCVPLNINDVLLYCILQYLILRETNTAFSMRKKEGTISISG
jgi:hypothetical protein